MTLWRITAPYFVAGFITNDASVVVKAAPIIYNQIIGRTIGTVADLCRKRKWKMENLDD